METTKKTQLTARAALLVSAVAFGLSGWAVGCQSKPTDTTTLQQKTTRIEQLPAKPVVGQPDPTKEKAKPDVKTTNPVTKPETKDPKTQPTGKLQADPGANVRMKRLVVTTRVEQREPVVSAPLTADQGPIVAFVELGNGSAEDQYVVVTFEHEDGIDTVGHIKLKVPAGQPRWRTWGRTRMIRDAGQWVAVVRTEDGRELGRQHFEVQPA